MRKVKEALYIRNYTLKTLLDNVSHLIASKTFVGDEAHCVPPTVLTSLELINRIDSMHASMVFHL